MLTLIRHRRKSFRVVGDDYGLASDVLLYVPFTDADASTGADGYVLSGGTHTLTTDVFARAGNAVINTDQTKMDSSSTAAYNPAGANSDGWELDSTISAGLEVGTASPLSIQFWFYCSNAGSGTFARLLSWGGYYSSGTGIEFESASGDYDLFKFYEFTGSGGNRRSLGTIQLTANDWNHIYWAFQPSGSSYLGINGTVTETANSYISNFAPTVDLNLLKTPAEADDSAKGYIQEFIVKDTVPYTANFTPSTTPLVVSTVTITDDFDRSDTLLESVATDEGWYWVNGRSSPDTMSVSSNKARVTNANDYTIYYANYSLGTDAEVQTTVTNEYLDRTSAVSVTARYTDYDNRYTVQRSHNSDDFRLYSTVSGTSTEIGTRYTADPSVPYTMKLVCDGDQISVYIGGVLRIGPVTDTSITTGNYVGIGGYNNGGNRIEVDDFVASSL